jgi:hypothetical protein
VRAQLEAFGPLWSQRGLPRNSAVTTVLLTNADLDHTLGLILLREGGPLQDVVLHGANIDRLPAIIALAESLEASSAGRGRSE